MVGTQTGEAQIVLFPVVSAPRCGGTKTVWAPEDGRCSACQLGPVQLGVVEEGGIWRARKKVGVQGGFFFTLGVFES